MEEKNDEVRTESVHISFNKREMKQLLELGLRVGARTPQQTIRMCIEFVVDHKDCPLNCKCNG